MEDAVMDKITVIIYGSGHVYLGEIMENPNSFFNIIHVKTTK
ncbi:hypothetical protein [Sinomicrobium pectinilyticum]|nr:hypothetical protein [Sinomicrobium pectinilyticum]